jgi:hypothetical protein
VDTLLSVPAGAAVPDSARLVPGGSGVVTTGRTAGLERADAARGAFSAPGWVMMRSAVLPGWGQWYNRQWVKALVIGGVEAGMAYRIYDDNRTLEDLDRRAAEALMNGDLELQNELALQYNDRLDTMVARQWLLAGVIVYALLDAYVDAHFRGFDVEFDSDPALEDGTPSSFGMRARLRWTF